MMRSSRAIAVIFACSALVARSAHAEPSQAELTTARRSFEAAVSLESEQRWTEAATRLREAIAIKDTPGLRFHLAKCEAEQGHLLGALAEYERVAELLRAGAKAPDVQKLLGPASDALKQRIPRLSLELPGDVPSPLVAVDGKQYGASDVALGIQLDPGRHGVRVTAAGRRAFERGFVAKEGESVAIRAELPSFESPAAVTPVSTASGVGATPPSGPRDGGSNTKLYLIIGESLVTAAGLAVGIGYKVAESSASGRIESAQTRLDDVSRGDPSACGSDDPAILSACSDLGRAIDDHDSARRLSTIGFVTAGVGAAALVTTLIVYPSRTEGSAGLRVRPLLGLGHVGLLGQF
jgi:hypothetical protein